MDYPKPRIVLSQCLELKACRYDGQVIHDSRIKALLPYIEVIPVCPEESLGLGTPRDPVDLVRTKQGVQMIQFSTDQNMTSRMANFATSFLAAISEIDGFIMKSRSPSCGLRDTKIYDDKTRVTYQKSGTGLFTRAVRAAFPLVPVEDEKHLSQPPYRHSFLTAVFTLARFREVGFTRETLPEFHDRHALLFQSYNMELERQMAKLSHSADERAGETIHSDYGKLLLQLFRSPPSRSCRAETVEIIFNELSGFVSKEENQQFFHQVTEYRAGHISIHSVNHLLLQRLKHYYRFNRYHRLYFFPFPPALLSPEPDA